MQRGSASVQHWISAMSRSSRTHNLRDTAAVAIVELREFSNVSLADP
jgi:hypothetical protein